jgi:hypothetical protein
VYLPGIVVRAICMPRIGAFGRVASSDPCVSHASTRCIAASSKSSGPCAQVITPPTASGSMRASSSSSRPGVPSAIASECASGAGVCACHIAFGDITSSRYSIDVAIGTPFESTRSNCTGRIGRRVRLRGCSPFSHADTIAARAATSASTKPISTKALAGRKPEAERKPSSRVLTGSLPRSGPHAAKVRDRAR